MERDSSLSLFVKLLAQTLPLLILRPLEIWLFGMDTFANLSMPFTSESSMFVYRFAFRSKDMVDMASISGRPVMPVTFDASDISSNF